MFDSHAAYRNEMMETMMGGDKGVLGSSACHPFVCVWLFYQYSVKSNWCKLFAHCPGQMRVLEMCAEIEANVNGCKGHGLVCLFS